MNTQPLRRPKHNYEPGAIFFITTNTHEWQPFFRDDANKLLLLEDFKFYCQKFGYKLFFYVILPNHFHWVIQPSPEDFESFKRDQIEHKKKYRSEPERYYLSKIMEDLERHCAFAINERENTKGRTIWQEGFWDEPVRGQKALDTIANYIHNNPVKAGLVDSPDEYRFSSYRNWNQSDNSLIELDTIE